MFELLDWKAFVSWDDDESLSAYSPPNLVPWNGQPRKQECLILHCWKEFPTWQVSSLPTWKPFPIFNISHCQNSPLNFPLCCPNPWFWIASFAIDKPVSQPVGVPFVHLYHIVSIIIGKFTSSPLSVAPKSLYHLLFQIPICKPLLPFFPTIYYLISPQEQPWFWKRLVNGVVSISWVTFSLTDTRNFVSLWSYFVDIALFSSRLLVHLDLFFFPLSMQAFMFH